MHFSELHHFSTQYAPVTFNNFSNTFILLPYYKYSTDKYFVEGHLAWREQFFALKYLPLLKNLNVNEAIYMNYLRTPQLKNYIETGYGLTEIFFIGRIVIFAGFEDFKYKYTGVRISLDIGL